LTVAVPTATTPLSVSQYAALLGRALRSVGPATLEGEVQEPRSSPSGILWFALTDGEATLSCKVFRQDVARLEHRPQDGDRVVVQVDRPDLWAKAGKLDLIVSAVRLAGEGELLRRRQELIERLAAEGLCEPSRWRPLPRFPRAVGVIAGRESEGMADVIRALRDRWPAVDIVACPSLVQGAAAPRDLIDALATLEGHPRVEVVVIARGGGSVQDLSCFDDERLCRAIFASRLAVVCAVGHTQNNPVCNHVTWSAFTPSRSAELVVPSREELRHELALAVAKLGRAPKRLTLLGGGLAAARTKLQPQLLFERRRAALREAAAPIEAAVRRFAGLQGALGGEAERIGRAARRQLVDHRRDYRNAIERLTGASRRGAARRLDGLARRLAGLAQALPAAARRALSATKREVSYTAGLIAARDLRSHGWVLVHRDNWPVRSVATLAVGIELDLTFRDGSARARVTASAPDDRAEERFLIEQPEKGRTTDG